MTTKTEEEEHVEWLLSGNFKPLRKEERKNYVKFGKDVNKEEEQEVKE